MSEPKLLLTAEAISLMYTCPFKVAVGEDLAVKIADVFPLSIAVLVLEKSGSMRALSELSASNLKYQTPFGAPTGLGGFLVGEGCQRAAQAWQVYIGACESHYVPAIEVASGFKRALQIKAAKWVARALSANLDELDRQSGVQEAEIAYLRQRNEQLLYHYEKARRVINGIGFDHKFLSINLTPSDQSVGLPEDMRAALSKGNLDGAVYALRQVLPCDIAGLAGISLFVRFSTEVCVRGYLDMKISRAADGHYIGGHKIPFEALEHGWNYLSLSNVATEAYGDAVLDVSWLITDGAGCAPSLALSNIDTHGFKLITPESMHGMHVLAMQVYTGLAETGALSHKHSQGGDEAGDLYWNKTLYTGAYTGLTALPFATGSSDLREHESVEVFAKGEWLQTHGQSGKLSGFMKPRMFAPGLERISVNVRTAHPKGPVCRYAMLTAPKGVFDDWSEEHYKNLMDGDVRIVDGAQNAGVLFDMWTGKPQQGGVLSICFDSADTSVSYRDIIFLAQVIGDKADFAWCQWSVLSLGYRPEPLTCAPTAIRIEAVETAKSRYSVRSIKFPELVGQFEFLSGKQELDRITEQLGFSPMMLSQETGSLQTHPIMGGHAAVICPRIVPAGAVNIRCDVETAHEYASSFIYIMAVMKRGSYDPKQQFDKIVDAIRAEGSSNIKGSLKDGSAEFCAVQIAALQPRTLALELPKPLDDAADLIVGVIAEGERCDYGWCRWISLNITSAIYDKPVIALSALE